MSVGRSVCRSVRRKFERAFFAQLQINTYFTYGMMRRRRKSRGGKEKEEEKEEDVII